MADCALILGKLLLIEQALKAAVEHVSILRHAVHHDDVDGITRGRWGLDNALEFCRQLGDEMDAEMPDWRPLPARTAQADGCSTSPDAHLGATEA